MNRRRFFSFLGVAPLAAVSVMPSLDIDELSVEPKSQEAWRDVRFTIESNEAFNKYILHA